MEAGILTLILSIICLFLTSSAHQIHNLSMTLASFGDDKFSFPEQHFLLYDVNPGEGFNLRRDVYMRIANTVRQLREMGHDFILVLTPWTKLWHWRNRQDVEIPWRDLFDIKSLSYFVPVMEFDEFVERNNGEPLNLVLYLQHYAEGWSNTEGFLLKHDILPCIDAHKYYQKRESKWEGPLFGEKISVNELICLSIQGQSSTLADAIIQNMKNRRTIIIDRAETILHDRFGDVYYWRARKSMNYAEPLKLIASQFQKEKIRSMNQQQNQSNSNEDGYIGVHLRRADFVWSHPEDIPSIEGAVKQVRRLAKSLRLRKVFLCTDANMEEVEKFAELLKNDGIAVWRFNPDEYAELSDAAVSIIDQLICSHASYFIGTHLSTFSFRIHEDREILGFPPETTFNRLCADEQIECEQPAKWTIIDE